MFSKRLLANRQKPSADRLFKVSETINLMVAKVCKDTFQALFSLSTPLRIRNDDTDRYKHMKLETQLQ